MDDCLFFVLTPFNDGKIDAEETQELVEYLEEIERDTKEVMVELVGAKS